MKITPREKRRHARSTIPEEKWGTTRSLVFQELSICHSKNDVFLMLIHAQNMHISLLLLEVNEEISKLTTDQTDL